MCDNPIDWCLMKEDTNTGELVELLYLCDSCSKDVWIDG